MSKLSKWLVSLLSICSFATYAQEGIGFEFPDTTHAVSGFVQYISFSDKGYHKDIAAGQLNVDLFVGDFDAIRSQVRTDFGITQLLYEHSNLNTKSNIESVIQLGRYVRLSGFYNDISDNSISSNMTVLPPATYLLKGNEGKMTIADGVKIKEKFFRPDYTITTEFAIGTTVVNADSQAHLQRFIFGFEQPDLKVTPTRWGAKDVVVKFETTDWEVYGSWDTFNYKTQDGNFVTDTNAYRFGAKYKWDHRATDIQLLRIDGSTKYNTPFGPAEDTAVWDGIAVTHQRFLANNWTLTGSYSTAIENYSNNTHTRFHEWMWGVSKYLPNENIMFTMSYHTYRGNALTSLYSEGKDRNVLGVSVTKAF